MQGLKYENVKRASSFHMQNVSNPSEMNLMKIF